MAGINFFKNYHADLNADVTNMSKLTKYMLWG